MPPPASGLPARLVLGPALRAQSDRRLVRLVREGYESAFEEIVRRYRRPLDRFAASIVGGRSEDVTQDSFRKALEALRDGEGTGAAPVALPDRPQHGAERPARPTARGGRARRGPDRRRPLGGARGGAARRSRDPDRPAEGAAREAARGAGDARAGRDEPRGDRHGARGQRRRGAPGDRPRTRRGPLRLRRPPPAAVDAGAGGAAPPGRRGGGRRSGCGRRRVAAIAVRRSGARAASARGAIKLGLATVIVAGSIGAGVAVQHHGGAHNRAPQAAAPAPGGPTADGLVDPLPRSSPMSKAPATWRWPAGPAEDRPGGGRGGDGIHRGERRGDRRRGHEAMGRPRHDRDGRRGVDALATTITVDVHRGAGDGRGRREQRDSSAGATTAASGRDPSVHSDGGSGFGDDSRSRPDGARVGGGSRRRAARTRGGYGRSRPKSSGRPRPKWLLRRRLVGLVGLGWRESGGSGESVSSSAWTPRSLAAAPDRPRNCRAPPRAVRLASHRHLRPTPAPRAAFHPHIVRGHSTTSGRRIGPSGESRNLSVIFAPARVEASKSQPQKEANQMRRLNLRAPRIAGLLALALGAVALLALSGVAAAKDHGQVTTTVTTAAITTPPPVPDARIGDDLVVRRDHRETDDRAARRRHRRADWSPKTREITLRGVRRPPRRDATAAATAATERGRQRRAERARRRSRRPRQRAR